MESLEATLLVAVVEESAPQQKSGTQYTLLLEGEHGALQTLEGGMFKSRWERAKAETKQGKGPKKQIHSNQKD